MSFERPLYWKQGMFLQPHHFQYLDQHHYQRNASLLAMQQPYSWGFSRLTINSESLANLSFEINKFEAVMPDGSYLCYPGNALVAARNLDALWSDKGQPLQLYLVMQKWSRNGSSVTSSEDLAGNQRYGYFSDQNLTDIFAGGNAIDAETLQYRLMVVTAAELERHSNAVSMPVARVMQGDETYVLDPDFAPPVVAIGACDALLASVRAVKEDVVRRAAMLEEYKGEAAGGAGLGQKALRYRLALQVLSRYGLWLQHMSNTVEAHPWDIYAIYTQLLGELSTFSMEYNALAERSGIEAQPLKYRHHELGETFRDARRLITHLLNGISVRPDLLVELKPGADRIFSQAIPDRFFSGNNRFFLVLKTHAKFEGLLNGFLQYAKIGSLQSVEEMLQRALPGVTAHYVTVHPEGLPRFPDAVYFQLDSNCDEWVSVRDRRNLALAWQEAPADVKVELIVMGGG
ncbi:MAG: type VI secretion system baseplate subunit TssK [Gammaproteobacteria bacterium]|nr:type VI secretion system baseplate subunit TssK [Gammaproteobacteria bacterium]